MNGLADGCFTGDAVKGSSKADDLEAGTEKTGSSTRDSAGGSAERFDVHTPDLRWLGMMSCMGSALITLVGAALITGHLLSIDVGNMVAEDEESPAGYTVAAGSDS